MEEMQRRKQPPELMEEYLDSFLAKYNAFVNAGGVLSVGQFVELVIEGLDGKYDTTTREYSGVADPDWLEMFMKLKIRAKSLTSIQQRNARRNTGMAFAAQDSGGRQQQRYIALQTAHSSDPAVNRPASAGAGPATVPHMYNENVISLENTTLVTRDVTGT